MRACVLMPLDRRFGLGREVHQSPNQLSDKFSSCWIEMNMKSENLSRISNEGEVRAHDGRSARSATMRSWVPILLCAILLVGGLLRFRGITSVGVRFDDEACYVADARLWHRCAKAVLNRRCIAAIINLDKKTIQTSLVEVGVDFNDRYVKPSQGYTVPAAIMMFILGDRPETLCVMNAMAGTISILVLYLLAARLFGSAIGLTSAAMLATSPYHLVYCRSALVEPLLALFILLGTMAWVISTQRSHRWRSYCFMAGLAFGWAITVHYRSAYFAPLLLAMDFLVSRHREAHPRDEQAPRQFKRWLMLCVGLMTPALVLETGFCTARLAAHIADGFWPVPTFLEGAWAWYGLVIRGRTAVEGSIPLDFSVLSAYGSYFIHWQGAAATFAVLVGVVMSLRSPGWGKWPAVVILSTMGILLFQRYVVARTLSGAIPFACICMAIAVIRCVGVLKEKRVRITAGLVLTLLLLTPPTRQCLAVAPKRSQIEDASATIKTSGPGAVALSLAGGQFRLYLDKSRCIDADRYRRLQTTPKEAIEDMRRLGTRWVIVDPQLWHYVDFQGDGVFKWWKSFEESLTQSATLAAEFPHINDACWEFLIEDSGDDYVALMSHENGGRLRIFDLNAYDAPVGAVHLGPELSESWPKSGR